MNDLREVDLERGMPRAEQAIRQMLFELRRSPGLGCSGVKLIHGYGPGESFSIIDSDTLAAFQRCPTLRRDRDLERHNNGVTFVLL